MRFDESLQQCRQMVWGASDRMSTERIMLFHFRGKLSQFRRNLVSPTATDCNSTSPRLALRFAPGTGESVSGCLLRFTRYPTLRSVSRPARKYAACLSLRSGSRRFRFGAALRVAADRRVASAAGDLARLLALCFAPGAGSEALGASEPDAAEGPFWHGSG
jgi:hypothetical protein